MTRIEILPPIVIALIVASLIYFVLNFVGPVATLIIGGSAALGYFAWLFTTYKKPADPKAVLPLYLLVVAFELIHMSEESMTDFAGRFGSLFGENFSIFAPMVLLFGGIWVLAGIGLIYKNPVANFIVWFVAIGPGVANGIAHFVFPVLAGTLYFPGLITVIFPFIASILLINRLLAGTRQISISVS